MFSEHWHVATSHNGRWEIPPDRWDRDTARRLVRELLLKDYHATRDPRYEKAIAAIDRGYDTYGVGGAFYSAFRCRCPEKIRREDRRGRSEVP